MKVLELNRNTLLNWSDQALRESVHPSAWNFKLIPKQRQKSDDQALLCWGKAAIATWEELQKRGRRASANVLIISPQPGTIDSLITVIGDHPIPGKRSFEAGRRVLEFFDHLGQARVKRLDVFLSGGASSLAWIPPAHGFQESVYTQGLSIQKMNRLRAEQCALKGGGAARWLKRLAPGCRARIHVLSDVSPFGMEVVGSGPFWTKEMEKNHFCIADGESWVRAFKKIALNRGEKVVAEVRAPVWSVDRWAKWVSQANQPGIYLGTGEPLIQVPEQSGLGGRLSHLGARILLEQFEEIAQGKREILLASSDGCDGRSGARAVVLQKRQAQKLVDSPMLQRALAKSLKSFDTATVLRRLGALIPAAPTGTNVQDLVIIKVASSASFLQKSKPG